MKTTTPQDPRLAKFWVGKLINISEQISDWDFEDDSEAISPGFKNRTEFEKWKNSVGQNDVLLTGMNEHDDCSVADAHFFFEFLDGRSMEAPCCITDGDLMPGSGEWDGLPEEVVTTIENYEIFVNFPKIK